MECIIKIGKMSFNLSGDQDDNIDDDHADVDDDVRDYKKTKVWRDFEDLFSWLSSLLTEGSLN